MLPIEYIQGSATLGGLPTLPRLFLVLILFLFSTILEAFLRGWNGYRNKSQHRKLTLEKKIFPPLLQGFEPATFQSRVRRYKHRAVTAPGYPKYLLSKFQRPMLHSLHWLPTEQRIEHKLSLLCFKIISHQTSIYLSELLHLHIPSRQSRFSADTSLAMRGWAKAR